MILGSIKKEKLKGNISNCNVYFDLGVYYKFFYDYLLSEKLAGSAVFAFENKDAVNTFIKNHKERYHEVRKNWKKESNGKVEEDQTFDALIVQFDASSGKLSKLIYLLFSQEKLETLVLVNPESKEQVENFIQNCFDYAISSPKKTNDENEEEIDSKGLGLK